MLRARSTHATLSALILACSGGEGGSTQGTTAESSTGGPTSGTSVSTGGNEGTTTGTSGASSASTTGVTEETGEPCDAGECSTSDAPCETSGCWTTGGGDTETSGGVVCEGVCGDGVRDYACEECDLGADNRDDGACTTKCQAGFCGDGLVHTGVESCDDGDEDPANGCANDCGNSFSYVPPRLVAGAFHMCLLGDAGKVRCWGGSTWKHGQLGYGSTQVVGNDPGEMPPPDVDVGGEVVQVSAGEVHTCAVLAEGNIRCWGHGGAGRLGYGDTENIGDEPGEMPPPDVDVGGAAVQVAAHAATTCALMASGAVRCWGTTPFDDVGDEPGEMPPPDLPVGGRVVQIDRDCAVRENGTVACWNTDQEPFGMFFGGFVVELSARSCARMASGALRCEGYNDYGQAGYGHTTYVGSAMKAGDVPVGGAVKRVAYGAHTCAILESGAVRCWGDNLGGGLGYGHTEALGDQPGELPTPDVLLGGPAIEIAVAGSYTCAVLVGGDVRCWGYGKDGNLGYGNYQSIGDMPGEMPPPVVPVF